uniref:Uncharacterized protein n=1 Tax=Arundo donax TaxID=35708 RepID=A0A0A9DA99_ARUDO
MSAIRHKSSTETNSTQVVLQILPHNSIQRKAHRNLKHVAEEQKKIKEGERGSEEKCR